MCFGLTYIFVYIQFHLGEQRNKYVYFNELITLNHFLELSTLYIMIITYEFQLPHCFLNLNNYNNF